MAFLDGALRIMPNWETNLFGHTLSWNLIVPAMIVPTIMIAGMLLYPWFEAWVTGDNREHHILDRPRNMPTRTAFGAMTLSYYCLLWFSGDNDIIANAFHLSINSITQVLRVAIFVVPPLVFTLTKRACLGLQRRDRDKLLHGYETGNIVRLPHGEFVEIHAPVSDEERAVLLAKSDIAPVPPTPAIDAHGVRDPKARKSALRARLSQWYYADNVAMPSAAELQAASHHAAEIAHH